MNISPACVLIIEHHPLMREALYAAISGEADLEAGMRAADGREALGLLKEILPEIILFALGNPGREDLDTLRTLRTSLPEIPILALISNEVPGQEQAALEAGASAVLTKAASRCELINTLHELRTLKMLKGPN